MSISSSLMKFSFTQGEIKRGAVVHLRFGPNPAAVSMHDAVHNGQSHTGALKLVGGVQPLENAEEPLGVLHVEARAVVLHEINALILSSLRADFDHGRIAVSRVLQRVGEQVKKDLVQQQDRKSSRLNSSHVSECRM